MAKDIKRLKSEAREKAKARIRRFSDEYIKATDIAAVENIISLPEYSEAETIFCFVGTKGEIDTMPLIKDAMMRGKKICVPKCEERPGIMHCREIMSPDDLEQGKFGIPEPSDWCRIVRKEEISFGVIPCLAASNDGRRLGFGGGYYDRYLSGAGFPCAVLCRESLLTDDIPEEGHDIRFTIVVTDKDVYRPRNGGDR